MWVAVGTLVCVPRYIGACRFSNAATFWGASLGRCHSWKRAGFHAHAKFVRWQLFHDCIVDCFLVYLISVSGGFASSNRVIPSRAMLVIAELTAQTLDR
jgi:hypothetical protein